MSILEEMLQEEYNRMEKIKKLCHDELATLPKGYLTFKTIKGNQYPYLQYRVGDKIVSEYVKKDSLEKIGKELLKRAAIERQLKQISLKMKKVKKVIGS